MKRKYQIERSREITRMLKAGYSNTAICKILGTSPTTVSHNKRNNKIKQEIFVPSDSNATWIRKNIPDGMTISEFVNSIITDARLEEQDDQ